MWTILYINKKKGIPFGDFFIIFRIKYNVYEPDTRWMMVFSAISSITVDDLAGRIIKTLFMPNELLKEKIVNDLRKTLLIIHNRMRQNFELLFPIRWWKCNFLGRNNIIVAFVMMNLLIDKLFELGAQERTILFLEYTKKCIFGLIIKKIDFYYWKEWRNIHS